MRPHRKIDSAAYAYLLGQYLGDGCISAGPRHVYRLRIITCDDYPGIRAECENAITRVMPGRKVGRIRGEGSTEVYCDSRHWPCLFPQHGPGRKHTRPLLFLPWQQRIMLNLHPALLLRGLIHSDGCSCINRVKRKVTSGVRRYEYVRYLFSNESGHIRGAFISACLRLGIDYRFNKPTSISVARRESVAILESIVGPKS